MRNVKTRRKLAFGLFTALVVGTVAGLVGSNREVVETKAANTYTWNAKSGDQNKLGNASGNAELGDITWAYTRGNASYEGWANPNIQLGSKNEPAGTTVLTGSLPAIYGDAISQVSVTTMGYGTAWRLTIKIGGTTYVNAATVSTNPTLGTITTGTISDGATGDIEITWSNGSRAIYLNKIEIVGLDLAPPAELTSIAVTTPPTKTNYYVGDSFDPAGMVVTAYYDDLSTSNVTNNVQITPTTLQLTDEFVTITYLTKSTTQPITVSERTFYTATLQYTGSTGNMTTGNNASSVGLNPTIFNVVSTERYPNPLHVGLNKDGQVRLYSGTPGNILTVSLQSAYSSYTIKSIKFSFGSSVTTAKIKADTDVIHDGSLTGNSDLSFGHIYSNQFSIENTGSSQIYILSIEINYLTSEQAALDFANEVMTGIGNNAESNCEVAYATLESIYGSLNTVSKALFDNSTEEIYSDARARMAYLQAWTAANTQSGDSTAGNVISDTREKSLSAALIIGLFGLTSLAGYYFLQKRKVI